MVRAGQFAVPLGERSPAGGGLWQWRPGSVIPEFEDDDKDPCNPECPEWPECLQDSESNEWCTDWYNEIFNEYVYNPDDYYDPNNNAGPSAGKCACALSGDKRVPSGCFTFENTTTNTDEGVIHSKIFSSKMYVQMNGYFIMGIKRETVMTNEEGCFMFSKKHKGEFRFYAKYKNDDVHVRNNTNPQIAEFPLGDASKPFNNLSFHIQPSSDKNYVGAHVLNSAYEFGVYSAQLGIADMPGEINVSVNNAATDDDGAAPMLNKGGLVEPGLLPCFSGNGWIKVLEFYVYTPSSPGIVVEVALVLLPLPDITFSTDLSVKASLEIQKTCYHEFTHASHYGVVGESYWKPYRSMLFIISVMARLLLANTPVTT
ncbi:MAG: hypothetical protein R2798_06685 [Chitinophagales bacterium]